MRDVRVRLHGGPADGRDVHIDADTSGRPVPRVSFPANLARTRSSTARPPMLVYERHDRRPDGVWVFRYIGVELR